MKSQVRAAREETKQRWEESFTEQVAWQAYNTAPVEAVIRTVAYALRDRLASGQRGDLHFLEMGCGAGPNLVWLAHKGIIVSGVDISPTALRLAREHLEEGGYRDRIGKLLEASVTDVPFENESFDGIIEACVFQHLAKEDRQRAFGEVRRLLKPEGLFVGYLLAQEHSIFQTKHADQLSDDPGTLELRDGGSKFHLSNIGLSHFFNRQEFFELLDGFSVIDPCAATYELPRREAQKRGYAEYLQSMWIVFAVK